MFGHTEVLKYLHSKRANVNATDNFGITPLLAAVYEVFFFYYYYYYYYYSSYFSIIICLFYFENIVVNLLWVH